MRILVLAVLLFASPASALEITSGSLFTSSDAEFDYSYNLSGDGFSVVGVFPTPFNVPSVFNGTSLTDGVVAAFGFTEFTIGAEHFVADDLSADFGSMVFLHAPLATPDTFETGDRFVDSAPFTMTAHLTLGDGFDFNGQGIVEAVWCNACPIDAGGFEPVLTIRYTFAVPEPPTLVLAALVLGVVILRRLRWS